MELVSCPSLFLFEAVKRMRAVTSDFRRSGSGYEPREMQVEIGDVDIDGALASRGLSRSRSAASLTVTRSPSGSISSQPAAGKGLSVMRGSISNPTLSAGRITDNTARSVTHGVKTSLSRKAQGAFLFCTVRGVTRAK